MEPETQFPPLPQEPQDTGASEMGQEQMKANLADLASKAEDKFRELNALDFMGKNQAEASRQEILREALRMMTKAGVDVSDPASIQKFMEDLERANPDVFTLFQQAFEALLKGEESSFPETPSQAPIDMEGQEIAQPVPENPISF